MNRVFLTLLISLIFAISCCNESEPIRVACIGDSITFGSNIEDREANSYPVQLGDLLGEEYIVKNFGVSGATLLFEGNKPYVETKAFAAMMEFKPEIAFIMLGTNDSKPINMELLEENYIDDYNSLIDSILTISPECKIITMTPPAAHNASNRMGGIDDKIITKSIIPKVRQISYDRKLDILDMHPMFIDYEYVMMPDSVHPSAIGATRVAKRVYEHINMECEEFKFKHDEGEISNFFGYECNEFLFNGKVSRVVSPKTCAEGRPWIWRSRFWGGEFTHTDIAMLERGYHIVYNDVADMFGSPTAVAQWENFYDYLISKGLNKKCTIEALSRGGLIAYNFAVRNGEKINLIYADAPVLDIKSWPISDPNNAKITQKLLEAYGFETIEEAKAYDKNPIDNTTKIAKGGFRMLHVCGEEDDVVPMAENTELFITLIESAGGDITYIGKPGVGHHPHSLENPEPIVEIILEATK